MPSFAAEENLKFTGSTGFFQDLQDLILLILRNPVNPVYLILCFAVPVVKFSSWLISRIA
jgi:hypothetical protein